MVTDLEYTATKLERRREIRALGSRDGKKLIYSGVYDWTINSLDEVKRIQQDTNINGIYVSINEVASSELITNKMSPGYDAKFPSSSDFSFRSWIMLDLDPNPGVTIDCFPLAKEIEKHLSDLYEFPIPWINISGRGIHMLYELNPVPNNETYNVIIKKCIKYVSNLFSTKDITVDPAVYTVGRHTKLVGTFARKNGQVVQTSIIQKPQGLLGIDNVIRVSDNIVETVRLASSLVDKGRLSRRTQATLAGQVQEGRRNDEMFIAACDFASKGYSQDEALSMLIAAGESIGLQSFEITASVRSAYKKPRASLNVTTVSFKNEWRSFPFFNHPMASALDIRVIPSNTDGAWSRFAGQIAMKAYPGWITLNGESIEGGKILGARFLSSEHTKVHSIEEWIERVKHEPTIYIHSHV